MVIDERKQLLIEWLTGVFSTNKFSCEPASSDASFRRYFRVKFGGQSYVVMDAPPTHEDCVPFITVADVLSKHGINAPTIFHQSVEKGFLVLSDFGSDSFLDKLSDLTVDQYYDDAVQALHKMHDISLSEISIPRYDLSLLLQEMSLFEEWFIKKLLAVDLSVDDKKNLLDVKERLAQSALEQPQVFVHRDYHSRNLMVTNTDNPGVIDFQDAVVGPISYDLVSLFRDCYIDWPDEKIYAWLDQFFQQRQGRGCSDHFDQAQLYQWFDWMGVQRHMKAIGIFSRLLLRDDKEGYLKDIPRTLAYVVAICARYEELKPLAELIGKYQLMAKFEALQLQRAAS
jgi:aminoglycoside/choline kinase family phosphotransferase